MGWKGVVRSVVAASRAAGREQERRNKQYQKHLAAVARQQAVEDATVAVREYDEYVTAVQSLHKACSEKINWRHKASKKLPPPPTYNKKHEEAARSKLDKYQATIFDRMLKRVEKKKSGMRGNIEESIQLDRTEYDHAKKSYSDLIEEIASERELASLLLDGNEEASLDIIRQADPFSSVEALGSAVEFKFLSPKVLRIDLHIHGKEIIPKQSFSLLKTGKISIKDLPKNHFNKLFQDHVCSAAIRVSREVFALLPVSAVIVNALDEVLDSSTGHLALSPILSVYMPEETLTRLNFDRIDPSDSLSNFLHRMEFKPTTGFKSVIALDLPETMP